VAEVAVELAEPLRAGDPPILGRIEHGRLLLDPRTLTEEETEMVARVCANLTASGGV
jgi:L-seryl-tRNA(Ser) seleniumtransferase